MDIMQQGLLGNGKRERLVGGLPGGWEADGRKAFVVQAKEFHHPRHVIRSPDENAHPAGIGQDMMRAGSTGGHQVLPDADGEWEVGQPVTVEVTDLAVPDAELNAPETVGMGGDARPAGHCVDNRLGDSAHGGPTYDEKSVDRDAGADPAGGGNALLRRSGISGNATRISSATAMRAPASP